MTLQFLKENPAMLFAYLISLFLLPINDILMPILTGNVVKAIGGKMDIMMPFIKVVVVIVVLQIGIYLSDLMEVRVFPKMTNFFRKQMINYIIDLNETYYSEQETGSIIARLVKLPGTFYSVLEIIRVYLIPMTVVFAIAIGYFFYIDKALGMALAFTVLIIMSMVYFVPHYCMPQSSERDQVFNTMHEEIEDVLRNLMSVYNSGQRKEEDTRLVGFQDRFTLLNGDSVACALKFKGVLVAFQLCFFGFFMFRCYKLVKGKKMDTGLFVSLFLIMLYLNGSMLRLVGQLKDLVIKMGILDESMKMFAEDIALATCDKKTIRGNGDKSVVIELVDVSLQYHGTRLDAVAKKNIAVMEGECVLLKGRNGAGKSSVLKLIMKYNLPTVGDLYYRGTPYCQLTPEFIRKEIGFVPQTPLLFNRSIYDNIVYGTERADRPVKTRMEIETMLMDLGLSGIFAKFPNGIDGMVGKNGSHLSGGQRQICTVLRVILQDPPVILMDEPTAAIDDGTKAVVQELLQRLIKDKTRTIIMVSHDEFLEKFADRILTL